VITLPTDLEIEQNLVPVRLAVLEATRTVRSPRRSTRYRTTRNVLIAAVAIAALTAGAIAVTRSFQDTIDNSFSCYQHASLDSHVQPVAGAGDSTDDPGDPLELCAQVWHDGFFEPGGPPPAGEGDSDVPELIACTLPDGTAGVFPREGHPAQGFCGALGLAEWDSD